MRGLGVQGLGFNVGIMLGVYWDNGKYYLRLMVKGFGLTV